MTSFTTSRESRSSAPRLASSSLSPDIIAMAIFIKHLVATWEKTQAELHGQYSLERLEDFHAHAHAVAGSKNTVAYVLTPIPCLAVFALFECLKLDLADAGALKSATYWIRLYGCTAMMVLMLLTQLQDEVPALMVTTCKVVVLSLILSLACLPPVYGWAYWLGFPAPFAFQMASLPFAVFSLIDFHRSYGELIRSRADVKEDVKSFFMVLQCQILQTFIYPMYAFVFAHLSSHAQTAFALLLPCIKTGAKNFISHMLGDLDNMKPEITSTPCSTGCRSQRQRRGAGRPLVGSAARAQHSSPPAPPRQHRRCRSRDPRAR
ncbi:hypothetical protein PybrP1_002911 [[Pythium] brassicae (nom. inval.)]|nr:hypothetical protein PybrP1_002911 [[Pythium] brassicae (nom. inval.)]